MLKWSYNWAQPLPIFESAPTEYSNLYFKMVGFKVSNPSVLSSHWSHSKLSLFIYGVILIFFISFSKRNIIFVQGSLKACLCVVAKTKHSSHVRKRNDNGIHKRCKQPQIFTHHEEIIFLNGVYFLSLKTQTKILKFIYELVIASAWRNKLVLQY